MHDLSNASLSTLEQTLTGVESRKLLEGLQSQIDKVSQGELRFQLQFVAFDKKGRPHKFKDLPTKRRKRHEVMLVLVRVSPGGEEVEWYGPLWFVDPDKNGKKRYLDSIDVTRMHWYAQESPTPCPTVALDRDDVGEDTVFFYTSKRGSTVRVPSITDESGQTVSLYHVKFR